MYTHKIIVKLLVQFCSSMIIVSNSNYVSITVFLGFATWPHFNEMCEVTKGAWPSTLCYVIIIML